ncbi:hypothetical protein Rhe02_68530 [Rhizocola hellebori]|uniref:DUF3043 domain-containing protein n=1 Tax=Rhizocola hellebori TaxID=1392758 RepID=A0A8J3VK69_9ACTN|nr:DUF3043 domain-containing protein [Rhizocola hellebori]GIH08786.1 hypothetical protein Rhe02_68530 [Rhizocola hellebori]
MALFSKKSDTNLPAVAAEEEVVHVSRSHTPSKGKATPKRTEAQRRKAEPPPANRREALKRSREKSKAERAEAYAGMKAGDERYLLPRDKGPERALVRDIVDSRRTAGPYFFAGAFPLLFLLQVRSVNAVVLAANIIWFMLAFAVVVDSVFISRRIKKLITERHPKTDQKMSSLYFYGIMRAISFRRLRMPKTRVQIGAKI